MKFLLNGLGVSNKLKFDVKYKQIIDVPVLLGKWTNTDNLSF